MTSESDMSVQEDKNKQTPHGLSDILSAAASLTPAQRALLRRISAHANPVTVAELADEADLHVSSVRESLDVLVATGLVSQEQLPQTGRGRPAQAYHSYIPADRDFPSKILDQLTHIMFSWLHGNASDPISTGEEMGRQWGEMALEMMHVPDHSHGGKVPNGFQLNEHMDKIRLFLTAFGFAAIPDADCDTALVLDACPFTDAENPDPIALALRRGMISGVLERTAGVLAGVEFIEDPTNPVRATIRLTSHIPHVPTTESSI